MSTKSNDNLVIPQEADTEVKATPEPEKEGAKLPLSTDEGGAAMLQHIADDNGEIKDDNGVEDDNIRPRRHLKHTEKGLKFKLQTYKATLNTQNNRLKRQIKLLTQLTSTESEISNIDRVNNEVASLDKIYADLCDTYTQAGKVTADGANEENEDYVAFTVSMDKAEADYFEMKCQSCQWLLDKETKLRMSESKSGRSSKSGKSSHSSKHSSKSSHRSSVHSKSSEGSVKSNASKLSLKQRAKLEGLKAEADAIIQSNEAELQAKLSRLHQKIAKEEAIDRVYQKELRSAEIEAEVAADVKKEESKEKKRAKAGR